MLEEDFYKKVGDRIIDFKSDYKLIDYLDSRSIILQDKFGIVKTAMSRLLEGKKPSYLSAINPLNYITNIILDKFPNFQHHYNIEDITYHGVGKKRRMKILVKTKYGYCISELCHLKEKKVPSIVSAVDKQSYFLNMLIDKNIYYKNGEFKVIGDYIENSVPIIIETKYGLCNVKPSALLFNEFVSIQSAINKTEYFINQLKDSNTTIQTHYKLDNFSYISHDTTTTAFCDNHGEFKITPLQISRGTFCTQCGKEKIANYHRDNPIGWTHTNWQNAGKRSRNFDSFKVYIIRCWHEGEDFYKIGKTFLTLVERFGKKPNSLLPYSYEVMEIFTSKEDGVYISKLEKELQKLNKDNKYLPKIKFGGMYECFKTVNYEL